MIFDANKQAFRLVPLQKHIHFTKDKVAPKRKAPEKNQIIEKQEQRKQAAKPTSITEKKTKTAGQAAKPKFGDIMKRMKGPGSSLLFGRGQNNKEDQPKKPRKRP